MGDAKQKLTTQQKIERELTYVKESLDLSPSEAKHWGYRIKREYENQERREKLLAQLKARKEFRKMLKTYQLPNVLNQEEDYEKFYDSPGTLTEQQIAANKEKEEPLPPQFESEKEAMFYKDDIDFLRFHKRTTKNVHEGLQQLIDSAKQTVYQGIKQNYKVTLNYVTLNRSCSVVNAWWQINRVEVFNQKQHLHANPESLHQLSIEAQMRSAEINKYKDDLVKKALEENHEVDPVQVRTALDQRSPTQYLKMLDVGKDRIIEAELQKRLTKAVPFLRGKLTQDLGLRYAPEIRFFRDNTLDIYDQFRDTAKTYLEETKRTTEESTLGVPKEAVELLSRIRTFKKMDTYER